MTRSIYSELDGADKRLISVCVHSRQKIYLNRMKRKRERRTVRMAREPRRWMIPRLLELFIVITVSFSKPVKSKK